MDGNAKIYYLGADWQEQVKCLAFTTLGKSPTPLLSSNLRAGKENCS